MTLGRALLRRRLLVVTGKGGVGKTTVAGLLGRWLADRGRTVVVIEVDPRESLHRLFDAPPSSGRVVALDDRLYLQNLRPRDVLDQLTRERLRIGFLARRVLDSPVYHHFTEGAPGLKELAVLGHAWRLLEGSTAEAPRPDVVVLDAPATGHGLSLLAAPALVSEVVEGGPFGAMARQLAEFVRAPEETGLVVATLAEEMPVQETLELVEGTRRRLGRAPDLVVANALYPPLPSPRPGTVESPRARLWRLRREANERELRRLAAAWDGPRVELPLVPAEAGAGLLGPLAARLAASLDAREAAS
ncbi:MAG: hypothetical protein Kow0062_13020 [Acidobacteriota bacterium]